MKTITKGVILHRAVACHSGLSLWSLFQNKVLNSDCNFTSIYCNKVCRYIL